MHHSSLFARSSLVEAGVTKHAALEGAAAGLSMSPAYCDYLYENFALGFATASEPAAGQLWQPHLNPYTVFAEMWHGDSVGKLSNADLSNACRLGEYLLLDTACYSCLEDVVVQRLARTGVDNQLLTAWLREAARKRVAWIMNQLPDHREWRLVCMGVGGVRSYAGQVAGNLLFYAAKWGHVTEIAEHVDASNARSSDVSYAAIGGGQLRVLQLIVKSRQGWPGSEALYYCIRECQDGLTAWALEHGAPTYYQYVDDAVMYSNLPALQWARSQRHLNDADVPRLLELPIISSVSSEWSLIPEAEKARRRQRVMAWLTSLLPDSAAQVAAQEVTVVQDATTSIGGLSIA
jgi:hypothetical protein